MRVWQALFNIIGVVFIVAWLGISIEQITEMDAFYTSSALKVKTEYACEAATYRYSANKAHWKDTYTAMMCNQYNIGASENNRNVILDNIESAIFISDNTIEYLTKSVAQDKFIVKIVPTAVKLTETSSIVLSLFEDKAIYVNDSLDKYEGQDLNQLKIIMSNLGVNIPAEELEAKKEVLKASLINEALLRSYVGLSDDVDRVAYIPVKTVEKLGINSVEGKTLIIIQKEFEDWKDNMITTAGFTETEREWILGFVENGVKYYCRADEAPDVGNAAGNRLFKNQYEAAEAGYLPATHYMR